MLEALRELLEIISNNPGAASILTACAALIAAVIGMAGVLVNASANKKVGMRTAEIARVKAIYDAGLAEHKVQADLITKMIELNPKRKASYLPPVVTILHAARVFDLLESRESNVGKVLERLKDSLSDSDVLSNFVEKRSEESRRASSINKPRIP